jgi:hypothetical protein
VTENVDTRLPVMYKRRMKRNVSQANIDSAVSSLTWRKGVAPKAEHTSQLRAVVGFLLEAGKQIDNDIVREQLRATADWSNDAAQKKVCRILACQLDGEVKMSDEGASRLLAAIREDDQMVELRGMSTDALAELADKRRGDAETQRLITLVLIERVRGG